MSYFCFASSKTMLVVLLDVAIGVGWYVTVLKYLSTYIETIPLKIFAPLLLE